MSSQVGKVWMPLLGVFGDEATAEIFSEPEYIRCWLEVLASLALVQAELNVIPRGAGAVIARELKGITIDSAQLHARTRHVGYPILPLLEQVRSQTPSVVGEYLHWGATTQDIMDTGLAIQHRKALARLEALLSSVGDVLVELSLRHRLTVMAARTHGQQAVPTTAGAKFAVWLDELGRHLTRLRGARPNVVLLQLFGAGGTSAGLMPQGARVRSDLARRLGLGVTHIPWHVARDSIAELGFVLAAIAQTCGKIASEIANLSRTEISEMAEARDPLHGASSTMPQKQNPVLCEAVIGMSGCSSGLLTSLLAAMRGGHERSIGEWQMEWDALPMLYGYAAGCLATLADVLGGIEIDEDKMLRNLELDGGMLTAEAVMMALAPIVGRTDAHEIVYRVCSDARRTDNAFVDLIRTEVDHSILGQIPPLEDLVAPRNYLGEAESIVDRAVAAWRDRSSTHATTRSEATTS